MRFVLWMAVLTALGPSVVRGQSAPSPTAGEILALEERWATMLTERNHESFEKLLAEDLRHVGFEGQIVGKQDYMAFFKAGDWRYSEYGLLSPQVTIEGCAAVVTGQVRRRIVVSGRETAGVFAFTHVWAKRQGEWRVIASQVSAPAS